MKQNQQTFSINQFQHAIVAVDTVIFRIYKGSLQTLLLELTREPYIGAWAVPGGLIVPQENIEQSVVRHLENKTGLKEVYSEQLATFGDIERDPRGRVVSVAYLALVAEAPNGLQTISDYSDIKWFAVDQLPILAYDHKKIISMALERLRAKVSYTNIAQHLLKKEFTLTELQLVYEIILGRSFDKRNFRKKILSLDIVKETKRKVTGAFRPATLYVFKHKNIKIIEVL